MLLQLQRQQLKKVLSQVVVQHISMHLRKLKNLLRHLLAMKRQVLRLSSRLLKLHSIHIAANAGLEGAVIINNVKRIRSEVQVLTRLNEEYVDMVDAGIVDPAKVTRSALTECYKCCIYTSYNRISCCNY